MRLHVIRIVTHSVFLAFILLQPLVPLFAQAYLPASTKELLDLSVHLEPKTVREGEKFRLVIAVSLKPGWHIYSVIPSDEEDAPPPTKVRLNSDLFSTDGPVYETRPVYKFEKVLNLEIYYHENKAELYQNLRLNGSPDPGEIAAQIEIVYQLCTDVICLPIQSRSEDIQFRIDSGKARDQFLFADRSINPLPGKKGTSELSGMLSGGFWAFLGLAALMGLVSLLTPCVFPMIPITITFFSKQAEGSQSRVIKLAVLFSAGIIITYTGFGLLMSIVFGAGSALTIAANPIVNLIIALVFIFFALSLMGVFIISFPAGIQGYFDRKARTMGGAVGVLLMGFTFTLTAFTCTVQFVGTMLIAASQGEWIWPLIGMIVFSSVFAFPFFLLAVVPSLVKKMQGKSGEWLGRSKFVLGVLELMASVKFLSNADLVWQTNLISRNTAILIWILLLVIIVAYLVWTGLRPRLLKSAWQWGSVLVFTCCTLLLIRGWNDRSLGSLIDAVLPPPSGIHLSSADFISKEEIKSVIWYSELEEAKRQSVLQNKPLFLEFTGYTCVNCRWMEQNVLALKKVHSVLTRDFILVRLYTDGGLNGEQNLDLQIRQFQTVALPYYVRYNPDGSVHGVFSGISLDAEEFIKFLTSSGPSRE
jgi:thiol:disulfide interchange protein